MKKLLSVLLAVFLIGTSVGCSAEKSETKQYDVVVVGAGAAGIASAIEAAEAGKRVAVIEKMPMVGGSTVLSAGIVYATGSKIQNELGIEDSVDALVEYWSQRAEGNNDEAMLRLVAEKSGETIDWLVDNIGVSMEDPGPAGTSLVARAHRATEGGYGIIAPMKTYAEGKNVEFFLETSATELVLNSDNEVTGIKAKDKDDTVINFEAKAVILATGGFDRSEEYMAKYAAEAVGESTYVATGNVGDGLKMAEQVNAEIVGNGSVIGFKAVEGESNLESEISSLIWMPFLFVNKEGNRFIDESSDYPITHEALLRQTDKRAFSIFDATTYNPLLDKAVEKGEAFVADSLEELAEQADIDKEALLSSVASYNQMVENGVDNQFNKPMNGMTKIETPKFYAVKLIAASIGTMTGIKTDLSGHVIDKEGNIVQNLYAAGEVANGDFYYKVYPASGTSIQMSLTMGRIAGQTAAESISE